MKKFFALLAVLTLVSSAVINASALSGDCVVDNADLLTDYEEAQLEDMIYKINESHGISAVIHTTYDTDGMYVEDYADNFYDNGGYGEDGFVFVISMAERVYYTSTCGRLVDDMPWYDIDTICEPVVPYLSSARYYEAFELYLTQVNGYLSGETDYGYESGEIIDYADDGYYYDDYSYTGGSSLTDSVFAKEVMLIIVAVVIAVVITMVLKSKMNTAVSKHDADDYVVSGSFSLDVSRDVFVGTHTSRRALPKNNNNNGTGSRPGGSGGGVRVSSGGVRHGGSGGKF